jgi:phosphatidylserine/phosphatidylglycerophosphate/cardiolipin synthase-like enzyme
MNDQSKLNLNHLKILDSRGRPARELEDWSLTSEDCTVYFRNLESNFIRHVSEADCVLGCMAWMTNSSILRALAEVKDGVSIVVQKEDFLRPEFNPMETGWKHHLRYEYDRLKETAGRNMLPRMSNISFGKDLRIEAVRCIGVNNRVRKASYPRMHNKFMILCQTTHEPILSNEGEFITEIIHYRPYEVWTGSFNFSETAVNSFENAVVIKNFQIAVAYYEEWAQILTLSEPLDWTKDHCDPQWSEDD